MSLNSHLSYMSRRWTRSDYGVRGGDVTSEEVELLKRRLEESDVLRYIMGVERDRRRTIYTCSSMIRWGRWL